MKNLGKVVRGSIVERTDWKQDLNKFLRGYRSAPHSSTGESPSVLFLGREVKTRLPSNGDVDAEPLETSRSKSQHGRVDRAIKADKKAKTKASVYQDKRRRACSVQFQVGDKVFVRQKRTNKYMTNFSPIVHEVLAVRGCFVTVLGPSGRSFARNSSRFKRVQPMVVAETGVEESVS
jgi:hypothetical protein